MSSVFNICGGENNSFTPAPKKIVPQGTLEITENGEYDVSQFADALVAVAGRTSNVITGDFIANADSGVQEIPIDYNGEGFPVAILVYPYGGTSASDNGINGVIHKYGYNYVAYLKGTREAPTYGGGASGSNIKGNYMLVYKSSDTGSTAKFGASSIFNAEANSNNAFVFLSPSKAHAYVSPKGAYGFIPNGHYSYVIEYSE